MWHEHGKEPTPKKSNNWIYAISFILVIVILFGGLISMAANNDKEREEKTKRGVDNGIIITGKHGDRERLFEKWELEDGTICYRPLNSRMMGCK